MKQKSVIYWIYCCKIGYSNENEFTGPLAIFFISLQLTGPYSSVSKNIIEAVIDQIVERKDLTSDYYLGDGKEGLTPSMYSIV